MKKKLIISGSSSLQDRINYWHGFFEGQGYEVVDYPVPVSEQELVDSYSSFFANLDNADVLFVMNEDKGGIAGYVGASTFAEILYTVVNNLNHGHKTEIWLLQEPADELPCFNELNFLLGQEFVKLYHRPGAKKSAKAIEAAVVEPPKAIAPVVAPKIAESPAVPANLPAEVAPTVIAKPEKTINILNCHKRCVRSLNPAARQYLNVLAGGEFPAFLLKYIAAPEFQRLNGVTNVSGIDQGGFYNFSHRLTTFAHSIGVALITWHFTKDKKQTLAALFHDIACPAFHHTVDFMNGDHEAQESTEERTAEIIRNSRVITRQLKRDGIMPGEVSDYKLFPIADNELPGLAADRLEYTLANGLLLYDLWELDDIKRFYNNLTILKNEHDIDELGFQNASIAENFTTQSLTLFSEYISDKCVASMQFIADVLKSMMLRDYLTSEDFYNMSEREIVDWILSCGDKTLAEAFRNFQRATAAWNGGAQKKDRYCATYRMKIRYIVPLVAGAIEDDAEPVAKRITALSDTADHAVKKFLDQKQPKYIGFDFEFEPYAE